MLAQNKEFLKWVCRRSLLTAVLAAAGALLGGPAALSSEAAAPNVIVLGFDGSLESWRQWAGRVDLGGPTTSAEEGKRVLEAAARDLCGRSSADPRLPWIAEDD